MAESVISSIYGIINFIYKWQCDNKEANEAVGKLKITMELVKNAVDSKLINNQMNLMGNRFGCKTIH